MTSLDYEQFVRREHAQLVRALTLQLGDQALAEQVVQDAFVRARERWDQVRAMASPRGWVYRVALNLARSWWRRQAAERRAYARHGSRALLRGDPPDPADVLTIRAALRRLPVRQREALVLRYFLDLPVADTAALMGLREGSVKSLTHRAINALRTDLLEVGITAEEVAEDA